MPADDTAARAARFGEGFLFDAWYYVALSRAVKTGKLKLLVGHDAGPK